MVSTGKKNTISNKSFISPLITYPLEATSLYHHQESDKLAHARTLLNFSLKTPFHVQY